MTSSQQDHVMQVTVLDFSPEHAISYNLLVDIVHRNLLTSDWYDPDHHESLLNVSKNSKWAREMLENIKKSCCVAGHCDLLAKREDVKETLELLVQRHRKPGSRITHSPPPLSPLSSSLFFAGMSSIFWAWLMDFRRLCEAVL